MSGCIDFMYRVCKYHERQIFRENEILSPRIAITRINVNRVSRSAYPDCRGLQAIERRIPIHQDINLWQLRGSRGSRSRAVTCRSGNDVVNG